MNQAEDLLTPIAVMLGITLTAAMISLGIIFGFQGIQGTVIVTYLVAVSIMVTYYVLTQMRTNPAWDLFGIYRYIRKGPCIDPPVVDIVLARAIAEPHLARAIGKSLRNAIKAHSQRNPDALDALDWLVRKPGIHPFWRLQDRTLSVIIEHPLFRIDYGKLLIDTEAIPASVVTAIDSRPLCEIIDIPFLRRDVMVSQADISVKSGCYAFDVFRDRRDLEGVIEALDALERANSHDLRTIRGFSQRLFPI